MKPAEKLKRIKLISEKLYCENIDEMFTPNHCIELAQIFVERFEQFEDQFLKENPVKGSELEVLSMCVP